MDPLKSLPIAGVTFKEGIRERAFLGILIFALLMLLASGLIADLSIGNTLKVAQDIGLSTVTFTGLLLAFFMGTHLLSKDLDKRSIYVVISKPISRGDYLFGKYLGLVSVVALSMILITLFLLLIIFYFYKTAHLYEVPQIHWGKLILASLFSFIEAALILAVSIFFCSFTSSALLALFLTLAVYIIGESTMQVREIVSSSIAQHMAPLEKKLAVGAYYLFPDLSLFDLKVFAVHGLPISKPDILKALVYGLCYVLLLLVGASLIFRKREMK